MARKVRRVAKQLPVFLALADKYLAIFTYATLQFLV